MTNINFPYNVYHNILTEIKELHPAYQRQYLHNNIAGELGMMGV